MNEKKKTLNPCITKVIRKRTLSEALTASNINICIANNFIQQSTQPSSPLSLTQIRPRSLSLNNTPTNKTPIRDPYAFRNEPKTGTNILRKQLFASKPPIGPQSVLTNILNEAMCPSRISSQMKKNLILKLEKRSNLIIKKK